MLLSTLNATYYIPRGEKKSVHVKHQKSYLLSISCTLEYSEHTFYTLTTAAMPIMTERDLFRIKFLKASQFHVLSTLSHLRWNCSTHLFFCLSTLWSNSEWAITISPGVFFPSPFNFCFDLAEQQALYKSRWKKLTYRTMML